MTCEDKNMNTKKKLDELRKYTDISKFDINAKVQMIIEEIQQQLAKWEQEARAIYYPESQKEANKRVK